jgi:hypothetical protein
MFEINHFKTFPFFSGDVIMIGQLRWRAPMSRELIEVDSYI